MIPDISTLTLTALSAMITPAVLILATGQLILTTSQRLARSMDRARKLSEKLESLVDSEKAPQKDQLFLLIHITAKRSRKLQKAMSILYIALSIFVCTSVAIGMVEVFDIPARWLPIVLGMAGIGFLFYATILLIGETRYALSAVNKEMDYLLQRSNHQGL